MVQVATRDKVLIIDVINYEKGKELNIFLRKLLVESEVKILAHTFKTDGYVLEHAKSMNPLDMKRIVELSDIIMDEETGDRVGMRFLSENFLKRSLKKGYQRTNWLARPLSENAIKYAVMEAVLPLLIFEEFKKQNPKFEISQFYAYVPPDVPPSSRAVKKKDKRKKTKRKKRMVDS